MLVKCLGFDHIQILDWTTGRRGIKKVTMSISQRLSSVAELNWTTDNATMR